MHEGPWALEHKVQGEVSLETKTEHNGYIQDLETVGLADIHVFNHVSWANIY